MARAGLVESTIGNDDGETFAVINRVTDSGRTFLRTFKYQTPSNTDLRPQEGLIRQLSTAS